MWLLKALGWLFKSIATVLGIVLVLAIGFIVLEIPVSLSWFKSPVETAASQALGAQVKIEGDVMLIPSLTPLLEIRSLRILESPLAASGDTLRVSKLLVALDILPLFYQKIHLDRVEAEKVEFNLVPGPSTADQPPAPEPGSAATSQQSASEPDPASDWEIVEVRYIRLGGLVLSFQPQVLQNPFVLQISQLTGAWPEGEKLKLNIKGKANKLSYSFEAAGGSLVQLHKDAKAWSVVLGGRFGRTLLDAKLSIQSAANPLNMGLEIKTKKIDVGGILSWFRLAEGIEASLGSLNVSLALTGSTLAEIVDQFRLEAELQGGRWLLRDPNTKAAAGLVVARGRLDIEPDKPSSLGLDLSIQDTPLKLAMTWGRMASGQETSQTVLDILAQGPAMSLKLSTRVSLPLKLGGLDLAMEIKAQNLKDVQRLLKVDLPEIKPFTIGGRLRILESGYRFSDLVWERGSSRLTGDISIDTTAKRPKLRASLQARQVQIEDFYVPERRRPPTPPDPQELRSKLRSVLAPMVMGMFDASVQVQVQRVFSGKDYWGSGSLSAELSNGRLSVKPLQVKLPGGEILITLAYQPTVKDLWLQTTAFLEDFDYGLIARMLDPKTKMGGLISLDLRLDTRAKTQSTLLARARGTIDFSLKPRDYQVGLINLWAVNLLQLIINDFGRTKKSKVNCMVAYLDVKNGVVSQRKIVLDTTQMRVTGKARIDLNTQQISCLFTPQAKEPQFLSLATPLSITGSLTNYKTSIGRGGVAGTVLHTISSPLHVPVRKIFQPRLPADGRDVCGKPLRRDPASPAKAPGKAVPGASHQPDG